MYSIAINFDGVEWKGEGETALDALKAIPVPVKIMQKSILTITKGEKTHKRPLTVQQARRLFYPLAQRVLAKALAHYVQ